MWPRENVWRDTLKVWINNLGREQMSFELTKTPVTIDDVDPFIGIDGPGATLCGPYHPLGQVRFGTDTDPPHRTNG